MIAPRFLDSFQPHPSIYQAAAGPRVGTLTADMASTAGHRDVSQNIEQTKSFTYWNYIAITAIAEKAMQQFPQLGVRAGRPSSTSQRLTLAQRTYLRQAYGMLDPWTELDPLPETHPLVELLRRVNPFDSWCEFMYETILFLELTGEFFWWMIPNGLGLPAEIYVVPTHWVHEQRDRAGFLESYRIIPDGDFTRLEEVPPEEMIHGMLKNPRSKVRGYSPLQAAPFWSDNALSIEQARWFGFRNGLKPDMLILLDGDQYKNPEQSVIDRIREKFIQRGAGVRRAGDPLILPTGVEAKAWDRSNAEMGYVESADQVRDNNLALHRTPKTIAGITQDVNRASFEGSMVAFCEMKVNPRLRFVAGVLQEKLCPLYDPRIVCWFDDCTPRNVEHELRETELDARIGAITPDERRQERGRDPMGEPMYETGWIPAGLQPLNEDLQPDPEDAPQPAAPPGAEDGDTEE